jgi:peptidoglycan/xylan/chitin deacetylase (PgdA/CDA1 family)
MRTIFYLMALPIANKPLIASTSLGGLRFSATRPPRHPTRDGARWAPLGLWLCTLLFASGCASRSPAGRSTLPATATATATRPVAASQPASQPASVPHGTKPPTSAPTGASATSSPTSRAVASRPTRPRLAKIVRCGLPTSKQVALTFDDGPYRSRGQTERVLEILARKRVKATFFIVGRLARRYPKLLRRTHSEGHLLASHSWDHPKRQSRKGWISQLRRTEAAVRRAGVPLSRYYRPPHGITNALVRKVCGELGYTIVLYTLLSSDWRRPGVPALIKQVTHRLHRGGIVVLHDGGGDRRQTIAALPAIIDGLRKRGLEPVRLDRLLEGGSKQQACAGKPAARARGPKR